MGTILRSNEEQKLLDSITNCWAEYESSLHRDEQFAVLKNIRIRIRQLEDSLQQLRNKTTRSNAYQTGSMHR